MDSEAHENEALALPELDYSEPPAGSDRRAFMMRSAMATAIVALGGTVNPLWAQAPASAAARSKPSIRTCRWSRTAKGPVMTLVDEFYKVGPGPSSSHTIGPMRITYDFYQRAIKLPAGAAWPGDGAQGPSVRQPQRDRQGPRHRARRAGRSHRI